ncbi:MAG: hypothetical protein N3G76_01745 [Candidatus Micrarchaeota archaeon]|nr:hypothetical protein [Candidatus Micrarchaeota archaeon]
MMKLNFDYGKNGFYFESASLEDGLVGVYNAIGDLPYALLGIDAMKIRTELQKSAANDFSGMLQQVKVGEIVKNAGGSEFMHLCEPIIFDEIVKRFFGDAVPKKSISLSAPQLKGKMVFINDSKDWVIVKKATVGSDTTAREAAAFLFGVKAAVYSKYLSIKCPQRSADSAMMAKALKGKRKSLGALNDAYNASGGRLCAFLEGAALLGYAPTPSQDTIKEAFPELKLPGMRGRKPKG